MAQNRRAMYEAWVREYAGDLYRCALRLTGRADAAEELVQETFYEAWRSIGSLRDTDKARLWLLKILRHRYAHWVRDETRKPKSNTALLPDDKSVIAGTAPPDPGSAVIERDALQQALDALDDRYKLPFVLVFLEGFTCEEVSQMMDTPLGTVLSRIHRARLFLREHLKRQDAPAARTLRLHREDAPGGPEVQERKTQTGGPQ